MSIRSRECPNQTREVDVLTMRHPTAEASTTCDGSEQETTFVASNINTQCEVDSSHTSCSVSSTGGVQIDYINSYSIFNQPSGNEECHVYYGPGHLPSGEQAGTITVNFSVKYIDVFNAVQKSSTVPVTCN